jgi:pimeloyl-ACP methyl ester carboxylesterase
MALDHRGHGDSPWADSYPLEDYLQELMEVIEALDLRDLVLMGHSAGGKNSFIHTARHPERIARLVIVDMDPDAHNPSSVEMVSRYKSESDEYPDLDAVVERLRSRQPRSSEDVLRHNATHLTKALPAGGLTWKRDRNVVLTYDRPDAWGYLPRLSVPTLVLRGADSTLLTGPVAQRMREQIPSGRLVELEGGGHWVHLEQPEAFLRAVTDFLMAPVPSGRQR